MTLSIYIKRRLLGDVVTLLIIAGSIYLAANLFNKNAAEHDETEKMVLIDSNKDGEHS